MEGQCQHLQCATTIFRRLQCVDWKDKTSTSNRSVHKGVVLDANDLDATVAVCAPPPAPSPSPGLQADPKTISRLPPSQRHGLHAQKCLQPPSHGAESRSEPASSSVSLKEHTERIKQGKRQHNERLRSTVVGKERCASRYSKRKKTHAHIASATPVLHRSSHAWLHSALRITQSGRVI
jgi:hypothetical protein